MARNVTPPHTMANTAALRPGARHHKSGGIAFKRRLTGKCIALAMQGNHSAMRICMERISPARRGAIVKMNLPPIKTAGDVDKAAENVTQAIQCGDLTPTEGSIMMNILESRSRVIERVQLESRLEKLEATLASAALPRAA